MIEAIRAGLADPNPNIRQGAVVLAGTSGDKSLAGAVAGLLNDQFWQVREKAAWALGKLGDSSAVPVLMKLLGANKTVLLKRILDTLGQVAEEDPSSKDKDQEPPQVRRAAALALARLEREAVTGPLLKAYESANVNIKAAAVGGLANLKVKSAAEIFLECVKDQDPTLRAAGATALGKIRNHEALDELIALTEDQKWTVRREAVIALNHLKDEKAFEAIWTRLKDPRPEVRRVAVVAVGNTRREEAVEELAGILRADKSPEVRQAAIAALAGLGAVETLDSLGQALGDPDEGVKGEAARAVVRLVERD